MVGGLITSHSRRIDAVREERAGERRRPRYALKVTAVVLLPQTNTRTRSSLSGL